MPIPPARLRALIVEALYPESAYKLPHVCVRFGLAGGTGEEAFKSKRAYIEKRLSPLPLDRLLAVARAVEADSPSYELSEALAKIEEKGCRTASELTRRDVIAVLEGCDLSGRIELFDFIRERWPVDRMPSPYASDDGTFLGAMFQHMRRNDDWTNADLLQNLGVLACSQCRLFSLLEAVVHPRTRGQDEQERLVRALNAPLRRDGFALLPTGRISGYPVYSVREVTPSHGRPADAEVSVVLAAFDEEGVNAAWMKALDRRDGDPEGAITMARTLLGVRTRKCAECPARANGGGTQGTGGLSAA